MVGKWYLHQGQLKSADLSLFPRLVKFHLFLSQKLWGDKKQEAKRPYKSEHNGSVCVQKATCHLQGKGMRHSLHDGDIHHSVHGADRAQL